MDNGTVKSHTVNAAQCTRMKNRIWEVKEILELEGEFRSLDAQRITGTNINERFWITEGAWQVVDFYNPNPSDTKINVYRWNKPVKDYLTAYVENRDELPCGHRTHIFNDPQLPSEMMGCRFCAEEGEHPEYSQEMIEELV